MILMLLGGAISLCAAANHHAETVLIPEKRVKDWYAGKINCVPAVDGNTFIKENERKNWGHMSLEQRQRAIRIGSHIADLVHGLRGCADAH